MNNHAGTRPMKKSLAITTERPDMYVVFLIGDARYGIKITSVKEIIKPPPITRVPGSIEYFRGVINLRGTVVTVMSLQTRFGVESAGAGDDARVVVVDNGEGFSGLLVDGVSSITKFTEQMKEQTPTGMAVAGKEYISGIGKDEKGIVVILNLEKLLQ